MRHGCRSMFLVMLSDDPLAGNIVSLHMQPMGKLYNVSQFEVSGECDGILIGLNVTSMQADIPVASVRSFSVGGNDVSFYKGGGCIRNRKSGATAKFLEMGGVYFLKLKLKQPTTVGAKGKLDVVRPAP